MRSITTERRRRLCRDLLEYGDAVIGFADVGSGGELKRPWNLLPPSRLEKFEFEPTQAGDSRLPLCVSNKTGAAQFHIAHNERASSFHTPLLDFVRRFGLESIQPRRTIEVECTTLDHHFDGRFDAIDALDVNVEGHDYQVLQGAIRLLAGGTLKLLKVEFELAPVWEGQGWFGDIDSLLRENRYRLAGIDIDFLRPVNARHCFHRGEPLWGKAVYVPNARRWALTFEQLRGNSAALQKTLAKAVALCIAADIPGEAFDVLDQGAETGALIQLNPGRIKASIGSAYRWAKLEHGAHEFASLVTRAIRHAGRRL